MKVWRYEFCTMKLKTYIIMVSFFLIQYSSYSQNLFFGFHAGENIASARTHSDLKHTVSSNAGILVGVQATYQLSDNFSVRLEPSYVEKGAEIETLYEGLIHNHQVKIISFDFPLLLEYHIFNDTFTPTIFLGTNFSYIPGAYDMWIAYYQNGAPFFADRMKLDLSESVVSSDVCLDTGIGIKYKFHSHGFVSGEVRYEYGLVNLLKKDFKGISGTWNTSDVRIQISISVAFD